MYTNETITHSESKYSQEQMTEVKKAEVSGTAPGLARMFRHCAFMQHCKTDAAIISDHERNAMITNLASFAGGTKTIHALSSQLPDYKLEKTQEEINSFLKSAAQPATCQAICDNGFQCPKRAFEECTAKSPAELGRIPLSADALVDEIKKLPVTGSAVKDSQTAEKFVRDFLYNQDDITAKTAIASELCAHFKLASPIVRSLQSVLKESQKSYQAIANRMETRPWYVRTDNGVQFRPGTLAEHLAETQNIFFAAGRHYQYQKGVYSEILLP